MCFLADEEMFPPEKRFCDGSLADTIDHVNRTAGKHVRLFIRNFID
jgi:hypothetical protein